MQASVFNMIEFCLLAFVTSKTKLRIFEAPFNRNTFSFNSIVSDFIQCLACKQDLGPSLSSWARSSNWLFAQLFGAWRMKRKLNAHFKPLGYLRKLSRSIFIFFPILFNGIFKKTLASSELPLFTFKIYEKEKRSCWKSS